MLPPDASIGGAVSVQEEGFQIHAAGDTAGEAAKITDHRNPGSSWASPLTLLKAGPSERYPALCFMALFLPGRELWF